MKETSRITDELAILRGVHHNFNNHIAGTYITLTGSDNQPNMDREADADDFPGPGAILNLFETRTPRVPRSISLPNWLSIPGPSNRMPGQYAGFLGSVHDPFLIKGDPNSANYNPLSLDLAGGMTAERFHRRLSLREQLDSSARLIEKNMRDRQDGLLQSAYDLVTDGRRLVRVSGGHPLMPRVTALGCALSGVVAAFLATDQDPLVATCAALVCYGEAGSRAGRTAQGPGSFAVAASAARERVREPRAPVAGRHLRPRARRDERVSSFLRSPPGFLRL